MPTYETIPPHPEDGARLELLEQGNNGYSVLSQKQNINIPAAVKMETTHENNKETSYSKLELRTVHCTNTRSKDSDYSKLETLDIQCNATRKNITSKDVHEEARNESNEGDERTVDKVNSEEGNNEIENHDSDSDVDTGKDEERIKSLVAREPDTQNIRYSYVVCIDYSIPHRIACTVPS